MFVDKMFYNGNILTMEDIDYNFMGVIKNKIAILGNDNYLEYIDNSTKLVDLENKTILPGFIDTHAHLLGYGRSFHMIDLSGAESINEVKKIVKEYINKNKLEKSKWIYGRGWDQNKFVEDFKRFPSKYDLDEITEEYPILLIRTCGHIGWVNSKAIKDTKIDNDIFIEGGEFDRDENGELLGIIRESALEWYKKQIPSLPDIEELKKFIISGAEEMLKFGVTSIHTEDSYDLGYSGDFSNIFNAYRELVKEELLPLRIYQKVSLPKKKDIEEFIKTGIKTGYGDDFYRIGPVKQWCDGTVGARTAALIDDYSDDTGNKGILVYEDEELYENIKLCHESGYQMCLHAIGDKALEQVIKAYKKVLGESNYKIHRHRIVHCQIGNKELYKEMANENLIINIQPLSTATDIPIMGLRLGDRERECHNWKTINDLGVTITASSDIPVELPNVFYGIHAIVNRKDTDGRPEEGWLIEESVSVKDALIMYTINGAISEFTDQIKGSLKIGKLADFVIVDKNPLEIDKKDIKDLVVLETYVDGECRFSINS